MTFFRNGSGFTGSNVSWFVVINCPASISPITRRGGSRGVPPFFLLFLSVPLGPTSVVSTACPFAPRALLWRLWRLSFLTIMPGRRAACEHRPRRVLKGVPFSGSGSPVAFWCDVRSAGRMLGSQAAGAAPKGSRSDLSCLWIAGHDAVSCLGVWGSLGLMK